MCADCAGMRYCAYDHSESKYLGRGINGVSGEKVDCRFLRGRICKRLHRNWFRTTYEAPEPEVRAKTWTVPLSLQTQTSRSSGRKATP